MPGIIDELGGMESIRSTALSGDGDAVYNMLASVIARLVDDRIAEQRPRMAIVTDKPGGDIAARFLDDDDDGSAPLGRARVGGVRFQPGDLVMMTPDGAGDYVATGPIITGEGGQEAVVGNPDLTADAVDTGKVRDRAITSNKMAVDGVKQEHVSNGAVGGDQVRGQSLEGRHLARNRSIHPDSLDRAYAEPKDYYDKNAAEGKFADKSSTANDIAKKADKTKVEEDLATKADKSALQTKADKSDLDPLATKKALSAAENTIKSLNSALKRLRNEFENYKANN